MTARRIVLCGTSIFFAAIESGLEATNMGEVLAFDHHGPGVLARVSALEPSVVIMEKIGDNLELAHAFLERGYPVILLDETQRKITALQGRPFAGAEVLEAGIGELTAVIEMVHLDL